MELISFPEETHVIAKNQPQYKPLPAHQVKNEEGEIICCWKLSMKERIKLLFSGLIWHSIYTFYHPLQPQLLQVDKPKMEDKDQYEIAN